MGHYSSSAPPRCSRCFRHARPAHRDRPPRPYRNLRNTATTTATATATAGRGRRPRRVLLERSAGPPARLTAAVGQTASRCSADGLPPGGCSLFRHNEPPLRRPKVTLGKPTPSCGGLVVLERVMPKTVETTVSARETFKFGRIPFPDRYLGSAEEGTRTEPRRPASRFLPWRP
jgi:hypothetical protein